MAQTLSWLEAIIEGTEEDESPKEYYLWSALAALAATVRRNVYLDQHKFLLYPNIFVLLVGPSGIRKGPPVALAKELVEALGVTRVISGRASIQAIIKEMGTSRTIKGSSHIIKDSSAFIASSEYASSLVDDDQALTILTDLYDAHYNNTWKNILVGRESDTLEKPIITLLGASNQVHLKEVISQRDVEGGFIARTFVISCTKKRTVNSLVYKPIKVLNKSGLIDYLRCVANLNGEFTWQPGAAELYDKWYRSMPETDDPTGTASRIHTSILKIAMLVSISKDLNLELTTDIIDEAIALSSDLIKHMNTVFMPGKGSETDLGKKITLVLQALMNSPDHTISRQKLMSNHWGYLDADSIDKVVETLVQPQIIRVEKQGNKASHTFYHLTELGMSAITKAEESINEEEV